MKRYMRLSGILFAFFALVVVVSLYGRAEAADVDDRVAKLTGSDLRQPSLTDGRGMVFDEKTVRDLIKIVEERRDDWKLQIQAIRLLGESASPLAANLLIRVVTDHFFTNECPALKWNGIVALGNFKDDSRVVDALLYRLNEDTLYLREAVIQSLGKIGNRDAFPYLISALGDKHFAIRMSAVRALGEIQDPEAIPFLKTILKNEADPLLRDEATKALEGLAMR